MTDYKKDFPLLAGSDIAYLDNAATAQRPEAVLKAVEDFYTKKNANPLRGLYELGIEATEAYEAARERVREFINAGKTSEVVFTRNSTESLNLIAYSYGLNSLKAGDEILISIDNHHSNILPWQMVSRQTGAKLVYLECQPDGSYRDEDMEALVTEKTRIAAMPQISNVLGRRNPVEKLTKLVHEKGGVIVIDAAQSAPHIPVDVQALGIDVLCFTGHKALLGPQGTGGLYVRPGLQVAPLVVGGSGVHSFDERHPDEMPTALEAGTLNVPGLAGLCAGVEWILAHGVETLCAKETALAALFYKNIRDLPNVKIYGDPEMALHAPIISLNIGDEDSARIADILWEDYSICVRAGAHCAPLMHKALGTVEQGVVRFSFSHFNTEAEVLQTAAAVQELAQEI